MVINANTGAVYNRTAGLIVKIVAKICRLAVRKLKIKIVGGRCSNLLVYRNLQIVLGIEVGIGCARKVKIVGHTDVVVTCVAVNTYVALRVKLPEVGAYKGVFNGAVVAVGHNGANTGIALVKLYGQIVVVQGPAAVLCRKVKLGVGLVCLDGGVGRSIVNL